MKKFSKQIQDKFTDMCKSGKLFRTSVTGDELWDIYIKSFKKEDVLKLVEKRWYAEIINGVYDNQGERDVERLRYNIKADLQSLQQPIQLDVEIEQVENSIKIVKLIP